MKRLACILIAVVLAGCSSKKTVGKVDMDKLVSLDSLWENLDEFTGKMVTLKFDTILATAAGTGKIASGEIWDVAAIMTNTRGLWQSKERWSSLVSAADTDCGRGEEKCFIDIGDYQIDITMVNGNTRFPKSIPMEEILNPFEPNAEDVAHEFVSFEKSRHRVLTCYLLGGEYAKREGSGRYNIFSRYLVVAPVGYQYDKEDVFPPLEWSAGIP